MTRPNLVKIPLLLTKLWYNCLFGINLLQPKILIINIRLKWIFWHAKRIYTTMGKWNSSAHKYSYITEAARFDLFGIKNAKSGFIASRCWSRNFCSIISLYQLNKCCMLLLYNLFYSSVQRISFNKIFLV